tara:strand:+ start:870 stop:1241 length:372 start_codon:yes stop_codon:yes gene_type:complete
MSKNRYKSISEVAKKLDLIDKKTGLPQTHTLRYWESQFKQIKPRIMAGKRRYYSDSDFEIIKKIKFLLKDQGLTIKGVKKILDKTTSESIDDAPSLGVYNPKLKNIKDRVKNITKIINELKKL